MQAFYTPAELARLLGVDVSTVRMWIRLDRLVAYRLAERVTGIPLSSVMELVGNSQDARPVGHFPTRGQRFSRGRTAAGKQYADFAYCFWRRPTNYLL